MVFTYWSIQVGFWSLDVMFYLLPDSYGIANYKAVIKACLFNSSGTVKKRFLQSMRSIHNHAGQESASEAGLLFQHARMDSLVS